MFNLLQRAKGLALNKTATTILDFYVKKKNLGELKSFDIEMSTKTLSRHLAKLISSPSYPYQN